MFREQTFRYFDVRMIAIKIDMMDVIGDCNFRV